MEPSTVAKIKAKNRLERWRHDPVTFVRDNFQVERDEWQIDFLNAYNTNQRTAAKACKGPGKTAVLAWCCWHFLLTRPQCKIAATSITGDNLRDGLWAEMAIWQQKSPVLTEQFEWTKTRIYSKDFPETWWMSARQWSKSADSQSQADTLAGLHAENIMFVLDEAGGIPAAVMAAAEAVLANEGSDAKILMCGNPTHLTGPLYSACTKERSYWKLIEITGDPDDPKRSKRISVDWARKQIATYGRDNPWVLVNVFGQFPPSSLNALLGPEDMKKAMARVLRPEAYNHMPKTLGVDVARHGDDRSVIFPRQGLVMFKPKVVRIPNTQELAGLVAQCIRKFQPDAVFVDATGGWGWGVIDALNAWGYAVTPVEFSGKASNRQYFNKRAEMAFEFANWVKGGGCLPDLPELTEEATAITYAFSKDQLQIAPKDEIKEELGRSPDLFDGGMLNFAYPVAKKDPLEAFRDKRQGAEYDPIRRHYEPLEENRVDDYNPLG